MQVGDDLPRLHIQRREQRRRAVSPVVMGPSFDLARQHRQQRRRAVQRLNLRLLIHAQHHGMRGRIDVEADDIADLSTKNGSGETLNVSLRCGCR